MKAVVRLTRLYIGACIIALCSMGAVASAQSLRIVTEAWPPLIKINDGVSGGLIWDMTYAVLAQMDVDATLEFVPWRRALYLVERQERDAVLAAGRSPEREAVMRFPTEPLLMSETVIFSRADNPIRFDGVDGLKGMTVGLSAGYNYSRQINEASDFERIAAPSVTAGFELLMRGRVDAFIVNREVGWYEARQQGVAPQLVASESPVSGGPVYLAFALDVPQSFVDQFDEALRAYHQSAAYQSMMGQYQAPK
ncbi:substrate-binding periplasmic protein [Marinobacter sp. 1Y8]